MEYWINPDGSGKVTVDYSAPALDGPKQAMVNTEALLSESKGVRQWSDISYKLEGDHCHLHATAYFDDVNQFQLGRTFALRPLVTRADDKIVSIAFDVDPEKRPAAANGDAPKLTPDQIKAKALELSQSLPKKQAQGMGKIMAEEVKQSRFEYIIHFPGKVQEATNLESTPDGGLRLVADGSRYAQVQSQIVSDPALLTRVLEAGEDPARSGRGPVMRAVLIEKMWGQSGGITARIVDDPKRPSSQPLFDFNAEVAKHKADYLDLAAKAGLLLTMPEINKENTLASLEAEPGQLLNANMPSALINVHGETVSKFYRVQLGTLVVLTDENGKPIEFKHGVQRSVQVSSAPIGPVPINPTTRFNMSVQVPKGHPVFKQIKGFFGIIVADSADETDLGLVDFKSGAKGSALNFTFSDISNMESEFRMGNGPAQKQVDTSMTVTMDRSATPLLIRIQDPNGQQLMDWNVDPIRIDRTYTMQTNAKFTDKVRIKVITLKNPRVIDVPFEFEDVPVEISK